MPNSRAKGKRGERECAAMLRDEGLPAKNVPQSDGKVNAEVVVRGMEHVHIECKRNEKLEPGNQLWKDAIEQAKRDALALGAEQWIVLHKQNRKLWMGTFQPEGWPCPLTVVGPASIATVLSKLASSPRTASSSPSARCTA